MRLSSTSRVAPPDRPASIADETLTAELARCGLGDAQAMAGIYEATSASVYRVAVLVSGDRLLAEVITRCAYLEVWRQAPSFVPREGSAVSWIMSIGYRQARAMQGPQE